jgi:hypothetical protein
MNTMEEYMKNYDMFKKHIVYDFQLGLGGIGDCIKFFMLILKLCIQHQIQLHYKVNNIVLEKYLKLVYPQMYIHQFSPSHIFTTLENIKVGYYVAHPGMFYNRGDENTIEMLIKDVFYFSEEVKQNPIVNLPTPYISIHLRLGDKYLETDPNFVLVKHDTRAYDQAKLFNFIEQSTEPIFFCCDQNTYKLKVKEKFTKIHISNCCIGHTSLSNTSEKQILDAVTECYLLTNSTKIISASYSGFSVVASRFNNTPFVNL